MDVLAHLNEEGNLAITTPLETLERAIEDLAARGIVEIEIIDDSVLPQDKIFRCAWELQDKTIVMNYNKIRNYIRSVRNRELIKLDSMAIAAERSGNTGRLDEINTEAQRLRDITNSADWVIDDEGILKTILEQCKVGV